VQCARFNNAIVLQSLGKHAEAKSGPSHTPIHTYTHTHIHIYTHTDIHTYRHTPIHRYTQTHMGAYLHSTWGILAHMVTVPGETVAGVNVNANSTICDHDHPHIPCVWVYGCMVYGVWVYGCMALVDLTSPRHACRATGALYVYVCMSVCVFVCMCICL